jgi:hypothetical protein
MDEHTEILPQLAAYHDGELTAAEKQKLESHLEDCPACRQRLSDWGALDRALLELPEPDLAGDGLVVETLAEIKRREAPVVRPAVPGPRRAWILWPVAAAAVVVLAAISIVKLRTDAPVPVAATPAQPAEAESDLALESVTTEADSVFTFEEPAAELAAAPREEPGVVGTASIETPEPKVAQPANAKAPSVPAPIDPTPLYAKLDTTAPVPIAVGDSGIPQFDVWSARLFDSLEAEAELRLVGPLPTDFVELNVVPEFEVDFVGVSYAIRDLLAPHHEATLVEPQELGPEQTYLVSNLRMERAALMARSQNQIVSAEVTLRLAEVTWRLANITADRDDVRSAIVAQTAAMRRQPQMATQAKARLAHLAGLID